MTITGFLLLGSGFFLISLVIVPEITHRLRTGTFYSQTPIYYGWIVLFTGALGAFAAVSIAGAVLGGLQSLISDDTGWSRASIGFTASAAFGCPAWSRRCWAPTPTVTVRDGWMPLGTVFLGLCMLGLGGVNAVWQFFLIALLARAIGQPIFIGLLPRTMAVNFFQRRRNIALAFTFACPAVASAINIQVILAIAASKGWRAGFRYLGFVTLVLTIPIFLVVRRRPEDIGLLPDGEKPDGTSRRSPARASADAQRRPQQTTAQPSDGWTARQAMGTPSFWLVSTSTFLVLAAASGIGFNMGSLLHRTRRTVHNASRHCPEREYAFVPVQPGVGIPGGQVFTTAYNLVRVLYDARNAILHAHSEQPGSAWIFRHRLGGVQFRQRCVDLNDHGSILWAKFLRDHHGRAAPIRGWRLRGGAKPRGADLRLHRQLVVR